MAPIKLNYPGLHDKIYQLTGAYSPEVVLHAALDSIDSAFAGQYLAAHKDAMTIVASALKLLHPAHQTDVLVKYVRNNITPSGHDLVNNLFRALKPEQRRFIVDQYMEREGIFGAEGPSAEYLEANLPQKVIDVMAERGAVAVAERFLSVHDLAESGIIRAQTNAERNNLAVRALVKHFEPPEGLAADDDVQAVTSDDARKVAKKQAFAQMRERILAADEADKQAYPLHTITLTTGREYRLKGFMGGTHTATLEQHPEVGSLLHYSPDKRTTWILRVVGHEYECGTNSEGALPILLVTVQA
jgi:hypothetical protein